MYNKSASRAKILHQFCFFLTHLSSIIFSFCKQTSLFSPSASSPHIFLHNISFLSTILHLLFSFLPQPISYSPLCNHSFISWTFLWLSYFPVNTRDIFVTEGHFVESSLLAFKLQAIPAFVHFPYAFMLSYFHTYPCLSPLTAKIPSILTHSFVTNMNIIFAAAARSVFLQCCIFVVFFPFATLQTTHTIGVLDFVQEEVGPLYKSKSCSSLIKDSLIFIRHVTLKTTPSPWPTPVPHKTAGNNLCRTQ